MLKPLYRIFSTFSILGILMLFYSWNIHSQAYKGLTKLNGTNTETFYSAGAKGQAEIMAQRYDEVISFYEPILDFKPSVTLLVLSEYDWKKYTQFPIYGMPHYTNENILVVASEDNDFWKSFIPPLDKLPPGLAEEISRVYSKPDGTLTMKGFFDLLAIHELAHAYHLQGKLNTQRRWMDELFSNIFLHTYIAEKEPRMLPALTIFPDMVVLSINSENLEYSSLKELEENYDKITTKHSKNYGWYQCRLHVAAANIYNEAGIEAIKNLWFQLKNQTEPLDDKALASMLAEKVHPAVAEVPRNWND